MAGESYDDPKFGVDQSLYLGELDLDAAVDSVKAAVKAFTKRKLKEVRGYIAGAGTADASGFDIYSGTSSIGALVIGTNTVGQFVDASLTDTTIAADGEIYLKNVNSDTQGTAMVTLEFQETF